MVRPEGETPSGRRPQGVEPRCTSPAGESPVPVSAEVPGSRPQAGGESLLSQAGRQKPLRREQVRGPQHEVKPAASSDAQCGSRAAHFTAKAMSGALGFGDSALGSTGVWGAAREQGLVWNRRGPSAQPWSRRDTPNKPSAKSGVVQRESEGIVVPEMVATNNAIYGKGPLGSRDDGRGKREGMTGTSGSNHPRGLVPVDKVRQLRRQLYVAAKRSTGRRFHALFDRIHRSDVLWEAWRRVRRNKGSAGVDKQTLVEVESYGVDRFVEEIATELRAGRYRPRAVLRRYIPKADGKRRPLGIPTVRDRVVQMAATLVLEPIFEADFLPCSYGFRPKRGATGALETIRKLGAKTGSNHVLDADIRDYFGSIDHEKLIKLVSRRVCDRRVLKLLRQWLGAGVMEDGREVALLSGTPQGGVISPLLSNIYLHVLDTVWTKQCAHLGTLVRYADDFVVLCGTGKSCEEAESRIHKILNRLGLELHPEKTRRVDLSWGHGGFDFLGCHLRKRLSGSIWEKQGRRVYFLQRWPSQRSMKRVRQRVKEKTGRNRSWVKDVRAIIDDLNPVLRGWGNYFRTGNAAQKFIQVDTYVWRRLHRFMVKRKGRNLHAGVARQWDRAFFHALRLHRLRGTVAYPEGA
jgi:RNA-directed DNA polymerase